MRDSKTTGDLQPGEQIVVYLDEEANRYHFPSRFNVPTFWRRIAATVVETDEIDGTATPGGVSDQHGTTVYVLGEPNKWRLRIMIGESRYTLDDVSGRFYFEVLPTHHPVCIECVEPWPCREHRQWGEALRFAAELDNLCHHCGKSIGGAHSVSFFDGIARRRYHLAQKYKGPDGRRCKDVAEEARRQIPGVRA